jgi:hypothetical protein
VSKGAPTIVAGDIANSNQQKPWEPVPELLDRADRAGWFWNGGFRHFLALLMGRTSDRGKMIHAALAKTSRQD